MQLEKQAGDLLLPRLGPSRHGRCAEHRRAEGQRPQPQSCETRQLEWGECDQRRRPQSPCASRRPGLSWRALPSL
eukprot:4565744-Alexandrium_andersonii.AAC.1